MRLPASPIRLIPRHHHHHHHHIRLARPDFFANRTFAPSPCLAHLVAKKPSRHAFRTTASALLALSKPRLTVLVVLTATVPYALYPTPDILAAADAATPSLGPVTLLLLTTGTALCSAAANALNMLYEPRTDNLMTRTRTRPLVRRLISPSTAALFAMTASALGTALLYAVHPTVSFLGAANIILYAAVYTPLKAYTALNTWVGAVVGATPPLMGWASAASTTSASDSFRDVLFAPDASSLGGWIMAALLFAWQFPHFMALSWSIRDEYRAAGLRMLAWTNPRRNARVALRYSLVFVPLCAALCAAGVTEWAFVVTSLPVNAWLARQAVLFWRYEGYKGSARGLFWASVVHLPAVMILALLHKKGLWESVFGGGADDEEEWDEDLD